MFDIIKLSYLPDIFSHLNRLNSSIQGPKEPILTSMNYYPELDISKCDWINDSFNKNISFTKCSLEKEEELAEIQNNRTLIKTQKCFNKLILIHIEKNAY